MADIDLSNKLQKLQTAYKANPFPSATERVDRLNRLEEMVVRNSETICAAVTADFGCRSTINTKASDILPVIEACKHAKRHIARWMRPERRNSKFPLNLLGAKSSVQYQPLGVVGNISAWNFPVQLSLVPLVDIFSAGNRAMLKPSELTSNTSQVIAELAAQNFSEEELAVVLGDAGIAAQFSALPFDHLLFTGSTYVGKLVAKAAAENLVPVTLELGGKNPVIVSESANIALAAEKIMWAKTLNGGQICLSPDTLFIHESKLSDFIQSCRQSVAKMYPNIATDQDFTHVISDQHASRLSEMVQEAKDLGTRVVEFAQKSGTCLPPCLVINPLSDTKLMTEEIFGGPLSVITYSDFEQAIRIINERPKPLALYYFGEVSAEAERLMRETSSGGMVINDCMIHQLQEDLPFGGVGNSGMRSYHGFDGFKNFSHARAIFKQSRFDPIRLIRPPYSSRMRAYIENQFKP